jgi:hypothetical protein
MATKKKAKSVKKSKPAAGKKATRKPALKKVAAKKKATKMAPAKKQAAKKQPAKRQAAKKLKIGRPEKVRKASPRKRAALEERSIPTRSGQSRSSQAHSGVQAGDLQGLRNTEGADSESVDELLEEGNAFEADVVAGVERADDEEEGEVHTHEVPEDDVPEEYLDKD